MTLQQLQYFLAAFDARLVHRRGGGAAPRAAVAVRAGPPARGRAGRAAVPARRPRADADRGGRTRCDPHAERRWPPPRPRARRSSAVRELRGGTATFGTCGTARYYPGTEIVDRVPPPPPERARPRRRPELVRGRRGRARRRARGRDGRAAHRRPRPRRRGRSCATRSSTPAADRARVRRPMTIEELAERAADPARRELRHRGPDAPPARRARPSASASRSSRRSTSRTSRRRSSSPRAGWATRSSRAGSCFASAAACPSGSAGCRSTSRSTTRSRSSRARGAPLSPASREFLALARGRLSELAQRLQTEPPRQRAPG